jgi:Na+-transporting methylmalonyl-CoA/oxaloacetate decarboxylase beta subunit
MIKLVVDVALALHTTLRLGAVLELEFLLLVPIKIRTKISNFPKNYLKPSLTNCC